MSESKRTEDQKLIALRSVRGTPLYHSSKIDFRVYPDAGKHQRLLAFVVDSTFEISISAFFTALSQYLFGFEGHRQIMAGVLATAFAIVLYSVIPVYLNAQTIGKKAFGLVLVDANKTRCSLLQLIFREVFIKPISLSLLFFVGLVYLLFGPRAVFHDILARTRVLSCR